VHINGKGNICYVYDAAEINFRNLHCSICWHKDKSCIWTAFNTTSVAGSQSNSGVDTYLAGHAEGDPVAFHKHARCDSSISWEFEFMERPLGIP